MKWKTLTLLILGVSVYTVLGALFFHLLEKPKEKQVRLDYWRFRNEIFDNGTCVTPEVLENIVTQVVTAYQQGALAINDVTDEGERWDIPSAVFFAATVITTIGYGNIAPATTGGRILCVFYALFGIPLVLATLSGISEKLMVLESKLARCFKRLDKYPRIQKICRFVFIFTIGVIFFILIPSTILLFTEDWKLSEGIYFSIISLTTIGFGDYVPGLHSTGRFRPVMRITLGVWIFIGLAWLSLLFTMIQSGMLNITEKIEKNDQPSASCICHEPAHAHASKQRNMERTNCRGGSYDLNQSEG